MENHEDILFTELTNIGLITLNRPKALNALTHAMILEMYDQLQEWEKNPEIKAIMIQGAGEKAFCAGGDIRKIYEARLDPDLAIKQFFYDEYRLNHRIFHYPKPYIALLDGITMGGGVGVSILGSYRIATERFLFAMPETSIGLFPDVGGSYYLSRCPGETGTYLGLTGQQIKTADALHLGLVNYFVAVEKMPDLIDCLATNYLGDHGNETIVHLVKKASSSDGVPPIAEQQAMIDSCFKYDSVEEIFAALEKEKNSEWCQKTLSTLKTKSPTSLKVTLKQIRLGKKLTLDECLKMEYRIVLNFLKQKDLYEGIRALIIDKDQKPNWQPGSLSEVTDKEVDAYFQPLKDTPELKFD